jgi:hypothetical protein
MKCPSTNLPSQTGLFANPAGYLSEFHKPFTWKPGLPPIQANLMTRM